MGPVATVTGIDWITHEPFTSICNRLQQAGSQMAREWVIEYVIENFKNSLSPTVSELYKIM